MPRNSVRCPTCGRILGEVVWQPMRIDRRPGRGALWLDPGGLERLAAEDHGSWLSALLERPTRNRQAGGTTREPAVIRPHIMCDAEEE